MNIHKVEDLSKLSQVVVEFYRNEFRGWKIDQNASLQDYFEIVLRDYFSEDEVVTIEELNSYFEGHFDDTIG